MSKIGENVGFSNLNNLFFIEFEKPRISQFGQKKSETGIILKMLVFKRTWICIRTTWLTFSLQNKEYKRNENVSFVFVVRKNPHK